MFEDSLVEQRIKTRRGVSTVVSFILQICFIAVIVIIPLLFTQAIPLNIGSVTTLVAPPPPPPPPPPPAAKAAPQTAQPKTAPVITKELTQPLKIPQKIAVVHENPTPEQSAAAPPVIGGVPGGVAGGVAGGVMGGVLSGVQTVVPKVAAPQRVRVSQGVSEGLLMKKVQPVYPTIAKNARVQGTVVLHAEIGKDGSIKNLQLVSGSPLLSAAAIDAVKQWKYKPYFLNGQPVEVDTTITVNFKLG